MKKMVRICLAGLLMLLCVTGAAAGGLPETLIPGGEAVGLQMTLDGVCVVEFADETPEKAGLKRGDVIAKIDGAPVMSAQALRIAVGASSGRPLKLTVLRDGRETTVTLAPHESENGLQLGVLVRDKMTGIGTVTFYDPSDGSFGALGHGINDGAALLPLRSGSVLPAQIVAVKRGASGSAGALQGAISAREACGTLACNTKCGVFGQTAGVERAAVPVAGRGQAHTGAATIRSTVRGTEVREYSVRIRKIDAKDALGRNFLIEVTDPALLEQTGGIVQGMSGSPILQDGRLIGAVTHVLIDDPTQGYGIFIETMLEAQKNTAASAAVHIRSGFSDEFFAAFRAADADFPATARHTDRLLAGRAAEIAVAPVGQAQPEVAEFHIFPLPLIDIAREHTENRQPHQNPHQDIEQRPENGGIDEIVA